ncbi:MAG: hypothetical protein PF588_04865, partial [Candidatus Kapabacteria bacterium]|nr:hypothetical protein [Candidatus Kapabacteria bacterium]
PRCGQAGGGARLGNLSKYCYFEKYLFLQLRYKTMKKLILVLLAVNFLLVNGCISIKKRSDLPQNITSSPSAAFQIDAPNGWVIDNSPLEEVGGAGIMLLMDGYELVSSPGFMVGMVSLPSENDMDSFIASEFKVYKKTDKDGYKKQIKTGKVEGHDYIIMDYVPGNKGDHQRVLYVQMNNAVAQIMFSAVTRANFIDHADAIYEVLNTFKSVPKYIGYIY